MKDGISAGESARMKKLIRRFAASFVLPLSSVLLLALAFCGCRTSAPPMPLREMVQELPSQILLRLQVLALRETVNASDGAPFPALGFQFAGDRVVPVEKPDTIAGVELTAPQLARWVANLDKAGATLYAAPGFTAGPNLSASSNYSTEKQYQANWRLDTRGATMQNAAVTPESKFSVRPELIPGTRDLLTSAGIEIRTADLDSFTLVDRFVGNDEKPVPLALLLPRQAILRIATQTLVRPGRTLVFAHYVKQYRSAPQPLKAAEKMLVIEQRIPYEFCGKDPYMHQRMFAEAMTNYSTNLILVDTDFAATEDELAECLELAKAVDTVVMTNYYARIVKTGNNRLLVKKLKEAGKKIVIVTNYPYVEGTTNEADAVVCNFSGTPDSIRAAVDVLWGKLKPSAKTKLPIKLGVQQESAVKKAPPAKSSLDLSYC